MNHEFKMLWRIRRAVNLAATIGLAQQASAVVSTTRRYELATYDRRTATCDAWFVASERGYNGLRAAVGATRDALARSIRAHRREIDEVWVACNVDHRGPVALIDCQWRED